MGKEESIPVSHHPSKIIEKDLMTGLCEKHNKPYDNLCGIPSLGLYIRACPDCKKEQALLSNEMLRKEEEALKTKKKILIENRLASAQIPPHFIDKSFANYNIKNKGQADAMNSIGWFLDNFDIAVGLIFLGALGTGKNHLACALVREVIENHNKTALITTAAKLVGEIKACWNDNDCSERDVIKSFLNPDLLIIDEIGVQFRSDTEIRFLTEIINERYEQMKPSILMGNVNLEELSESVGERVIDRFKESGKVVIFDWESWRGKIF